MILNLPLILFQARESEMPSWNILQICANLRPPHAPVVAICPVSFTIICFYASPSPNPHSPKRNDICMLTDRQTLTLCSLSRSWGLLLVLHCCHSSLYRIQATILQMTGIIINYPLWITIRQEYYTSFQMCHWCFFKIPTTRSCHWLKAT